MSECHVVVSRRSWQRAITGPSAWTLQCHVDVFKRSRQRATTSPNGLISTNVGMSRRRIQKIMATSHRESRGLIRTNVGMSHRRIPKIKAKSHHEPQGIAQQERRNVTWTYSEDHGNEPSQVSCIQSSMATSHHEFEMSRRRSKRSIAARLRKSWIVT